MKYLLFFILIPVLFLTDIMVGSRFYDFGVLTDYLSGNLTGGTFKVLHGVRLPRAITALIFGGALSVAGLLMQTFFRNPLAGPSVLGLTSGSSLGVAVAVMAGSMFGPEFTGWVSLLSYVIFAVAGGLLSLLLILGVSTRIKSNVTLLIFGLMFGYIASSAVSVLASFSGEKELKEFVHWGFGSFGKVDSYALLGCLSLGILVLFGITFGLQKKLNAWLLGDVYARSIGVDTKKIRWTILITAGLLTATVTAFCGPIAFLGLSVPHLAKGWFKSSDHRVLIPGCLLIGICLALFCDIVAKVPGYSDLTLPLNAVTSVIGAPIVIFVLLKNRRAVG
ncbi:MAG: iron ABC transporter permease [Flavobacteriales bacterium]|nr:iron ABC transporter permease [Flavobacteriales bacterium]